MKSFPSISARLRPLAVLVLALIASLARAADRPNFIIINIDDMGYADIGPFGSKLNRTPNLDRMAQEGRKLTCFYAAPVCSPSRAALMTGCYPKRVLPIPTVLFPGAAVGLNPAELTVAELLKARGYATACIGKWHLGDQPEFLPTRQGFDYYLGIPYSNDMGLAEEGSKSDLDAPIPQARPAKNAEAATADTGLTGANQPPLPLLESEKVLVRVKQDEQQGIVERYTTAAVKFIKANKDQPFFLYLPHTAVHFPIYPGKAFHKKSGNGIYGDWVEEVDWSVGQVLDTVRELKLEGRTLVLFTSDNGGTPRAVNAPLRGFKNSTWEGGMREPTIAWWPGKIPAGTATDEITGMMDVLPTFVKLAGGQVPADRKIDGGDIWPLLAGTPGAKSPHDVFYFYRGLKLEAVRSGSWKLHVTRTELYDLAKDIGEASNVAPANLEVVARLQALADAMKDDLGTDGIGPGCRPLGRVADPKPLIGRDGKFREGF
jgi:arylsulfatase A